MSFRPKDVVIAVVGGTGSGKSTFISKVSGQPVEVDHGLSPCTKLVESFTFKRNGHTVHLIDTPGFDGTTGSDALLLEDIAACLNQAYLSGIQINGIIYLHPISTPRVQGSASKSLRIIQKICGEDALSLLLLGSTMWDKEDHDIATGREQELIESGHFWGDIVNQGGKTFRFYNDDKSGMIACDYIIGKQEKKTLALQHQMVNEQKCLNETDAGLELQGEILHVKQLCKTRLIEAREEAQKAAQSNDVQLALVLTKTQLDLQAQLFTTQKALDLIHGDMEALHIRSEHALREELKELKEEEDRDDKIITEKADELKRLEALLEDLNEELNEEMKEDEPILDETPRPLSAPGSYLPALWEPPATSATSLTLARRPPVTQRPYLTEYKNGPVASASYSKALVRTYPSASRNDRMFPTRPSAPRANWERTRLIGSTSAQEEVKKVSAAYLNCKQEIDEVEKRKLIRRNRKDSCIMRLGVGTGSVGAVFQVAAFAATMAACNVM